MECEKCKKQLDTVCGSCHILKRNIKKQLDTVCGSCHILKRNIKKQEKQLEEYRKVTGDTTKKIHDMCGVYVPKMKRWITEDEFNKMIELKKPCYTNGV